MDLCSPDFAFLSEPQIFTSDLPHCMAPFKGEYSYELNSEEKVDPLLAMSKSKANGGVLAMWKKSLDKYVTVVKVDSSSFLPLIYSPPGAPISVHVALYLPTSGKEAEFMEAISQLINTVGDITNRFEHCLVFLRGDGNVNTNNTDRMTIFSSFLSSLNLVQTNILYKTYHHFLGAGAFDSNIDVILHSKDAPNEETITAIYCKNEHPEIDSHHDIIMSSVILPVTELQPPSNVLITAPRLHHQRYRILWSPQGISAYQEDVAEKLSQVRLDWLNPLSKTSMSILLARTNEIISTAARAANKFIKLDTPTQIKSEKKPIEIKNSETILRNIHGDPGATKSDLQTARRQHRTLVRSVKNKREIDQDEKLFSILSSNPSAAFSTIKRSKSSSNVQVPYITVGDKRYDGPRVVDGLYESISKLKHLDCDQLKASPHHHSLVGL